MSQKHISQVGLLLLLGFLVVFNTIDGAPIVDSDDKLKFMEEIDALDRQLSQQLLNRMLKHSLRIKRSDIDERLFDLQAKILLTKAYANYPAGHGKFNFDDVLKRSDDLSKYKDKLVEKRSIFQI